MKIVGLVSMGVLLLQAAADGGQVNVYTVILSFIAFMSLVGPGVLALMTARANQEARDRDHAREEARIRREEKRKERESAAALVAAERDTKHTGALAEIHTAANAQLSTLQDELRASREETKAAMQEAKALLVEQVGAAVAMAEPVAVRTEPGDALSVKGDEAEPVPVETVRKTRKAPNAAKE